MIGKKERRMAGHPAISTMDSIYLYDRTELEMAEHEAYRTGARRLLPSIACTPLYLDYDFTRAAY